MPPPPLFRDESERNIIPQEPIFTLLNKFNGVQTQVLHYSFIRSFSPSFSVHYFSFVSSSSLMYGCILTNVRHLFCFGCWNVVLQYFPVTNERKKYRITQLPRYLIVHIKRFTKNVWFTEKNPTIVTFPLKSLDLAPCICPLSSASHSRTCSLLFHSHTFSVLI
jgi:U4/U6.U5 tri-snRNP-associated protein 2